MKGLSGSIELVLEKHGGSGAPASPGRCTCEALQRRPVALGQPVALEPQALLVALELVDGLGGQSDPPGEGGEELGKPARAG
jgi:hypothetical protein